MPSGSTSGVIALPAGTTIVDVVSVALLVAIIVTVVLVARRTVAALARARELERFHAAVADLGGRIDATLGSLVVRVDAVRRRQLNAEAIEPDLATVVQRLLGFTAELETIREPSRGTGVRPGFAASVRGELERADRAIRMIAYGCEVLAHGRGRGYARTPDGETALKRGYLNLLHAREALAEDSAAWSGRPVASRQALHADERRSVEPPLDLRLDLPLDPPLESIAAQSPSHDAPVERSRSDDAPVDPGDAGDG